MESILGIEKNLGTLLGNNSVNTVQQLAQKTQSKSLSPVPGSGNEFASTLNQIQQVGKTKIANESQESQELMEVARQFEGLLLHQLLNSMRKTVNKSDLLKSFAGDQYESMLDEEMSKEMVKHRSIGLVDTIKHQLNRLAGIAA